MEGAQDTCCWISPPLAHAAVAAGSRAVHDAQSPRDGTVVEKELLCQPFYPLMYVPYAESLLRCAKFKQQQQQQQRPRVVGCSPERSLIGRLLDRRGWFSKLEPLLVLSLSLVGITCELWFHPGNVYWRKLYSSDGALLDDNLNVWQHALMYGAFSISAFVSLLHSPSARSAVPSERSTLVPASLPFVFLGLAFLNEAILFGFHLTDGRDAVAQVDHTLLTYVIFLTAAITICQCFAARARNNFVLAMARAYCTLLQGSWFFGIANNEYAEEYKLDASKPGHVMAVPMIFCIHALGWLIFLLLLYYLIVAQGLHAFAREHVGRGGSAFLGSVHDLDGDAGPRSVSSACACDGPGNSKQRRTSAH